MTETDPSPVKSDAPSSTEGAIEESDTLTILRRGDTTFYLVGTAHVSQASVHEVEHVIETVQPDVVCIELCRARYDALINDEVWKNLDVFKVIKQGKTMLLFANIILSSYQKSIGEQLGVKPGAEFKAAADKAREVGARVELVDRDVQATLKRTWANLRFTSKAKLIGMLLGIVQDEDAGDEGKGDSKNKGDNKDGGVTVEDIEKLKTQANFSEQLAQLTEFLPGIKKPFIDERDQYMISSIEESAQGPVRPAPTPKAKDGAEDGTAAPARNVVAVVGAMHVKGMRENFGKPVDRAVLDVIPPPPRWVRVLKWVIPVLILCAFAYGYFKHQDATLEDMLYAWVLPNSVMAALITALARAKLISILTAFVVSPITSLNPLLPAGVVVGLTEAWLRKPTVDDCEHIHEDIQTWRGVIRNPVTHVLLVAVASTIGSALGAWIGLSWLIALLA